MIAVETVPILAEMSTDDLRALYAELIRRTARGQALLEPLVGTGHPRFEEKFWDWKRLDAELCATEQELETRGAL